MNITQTNLWTDSQVTIIWIKAHPSRLKDYVRNRVIKIQELSKNAHLRYVPGTSNPADLASRGIFTDQLEKNTLWWTGPPWMTQSMASWPDQVKEAPDDSCAQEARASVALLRVISGISFTDSQRFIGCSELQLSAVDLSRGSQESLTQHQQLLSLLAGRKTHDSLGSRLLNRRTFKKKSHCSHVKLNCQARTRSVGSLHSLMLAGVVLRVGGRLSKSELMYKAKHSAILPRNSRFSELVIAHAHKKTMHEGTQSTLAFIRQLYWIIGGRGLLKSNVFKCVALTTLEHSRSRLLEPLSDDPEDTLVLTPGHFLIGAALNAVPESSLLDISASRLSRWQFIQQRVQQFWRMWSTHYLQQLQDISKWHHAYNHIQ
ncbi:PREDICTED: uncharacterized protein LOC107073566, partial [Polistes dominula]|uniref:Uncharacterized protein LOC107073566 n=1 Tax=Polistes dominula TaxID=743375 RepID=A0ABM1JBA8_POLDO